VSGQLLAPVVLLPETEPLVPIGQEVKGGPQSLYGQHGDVKILDPTGIRNLTLSVVQPVASRYTDCDTETLYGETNFVKGTSLYINIFSFAAEEKGLSSDIKNKEVLEKLLNHVYFAMY
jgi:hypothetical protein